MLSGNTTSNKEPAWCLLMQTDASLWNSTSKLFHMNSQTNDSAQATALGEVTLFQLGIVPGTSTLAFPLEELGYEYTDDIDPVMLAFNLSTRQVTIPVVEPGTITFQYGESPITYNFTSSGVYLLSFSDSWNMILSVTLQSALPSNLIYFYLPRSATVPEFPTLLVLLPLIAATLLALSLYRRKRIVYRNIPYVILCHGTGLADFCFFCSLSYFVSMMLCNAW